jgi:hypothetical protein
MSITPSERRHEITQFVWVWIIRGLALAYLWACYRVYHGTSLSIGNGLLTLGSLEIARSLDALRKTLGRRRGDWL